MSEYKSFQDILNFLSFGYKFDTKSYGYPFNRDPKNVIFSWGQIVIPKYGIREMVHNKISNNDEMPIKEIKMLYEIPFVVKDKDGDVHGIGTVNENISLGFRYDKQYKYGDITKSIYEVCLCILEHATETNDFFIIRDDYIQEFFSYYIIPNQWGLGTTLPISGCYEKYYGEKVNSDPKYARLYKCPCCENWVEPENNTCPYCGSTFSKFPEIDMSGPINTECDM